ncbi:MAG: histidine phosphatase family protein, partial [Myxococcota bacterium]
MAERTTSEESESTLRIGMDVRAGGQPALARDRSERVAPSPPTLAARESPSSRVAEQLRRLLLLRAGETAAHAAGRLVGTEDPGLTAFGRAQIEERRHQWEWADYVATSPFRRARESAAIFTGGAQAAVEASFGPLDFGRWQGVPLDKNAERDPIAFADWRAGRPTAQPPGGESLDNFRTRVAEGIERLFRAGRSAPLVVCHGEVIREIVEQLTGEVLSRESPAPSELVLLTLGPDGRFRLGRPSSDP